jgi:hypothetical protein
MPKRIDIYNNMSLSELDWIPGELVAFDNTDLECPLPLLLTLPKKITKGYEIPPKRILLIYPPQNGETEMWTLCSEENTLELWSPNHRRGSKVPDFDVSSSREIFSYPVETALAGKEAIQKYLQNNKQGLSFYAKCLESGRLVTERSLLEKLAQKVGLGFILPNQLRFRK